MIKGLTASQLRELEDYYSLEPFGEFSAEFRHGRAMALQANINRNEKVRSEAFTALDFVYYDFEKPEAPVESPEELSKRISSELFKL